jgi:hypothetical protein
MPGARTLDAISDFVGKEKKRPAAGAGLISDVVAGSAGKVSNNCMRDRKRDS